MARRSGRTLPLRETRPGQQEQRIVGQLHDPRAQQPDGNQQKHQGAQPGPAGPDDEQDEGGKRTERAECRVEGADHRQRQGRPEDDRATSGTACGTHESGRHQGQQNVRHDATEASTGNCCGEGRQ